MILRSILAVAALAGLSAVPAAAEPKGAGPKGTVADTASGNLGWTKSDNANENACFGQARGSWASSLGQGTNEFYPEGISNGDVLSKRAREGANHEDSEGFIEDYCD